MSAGNLQPINYSLMHRCSILTEPHLLLLHKMAHFYNFLGHDRVYVYDIFPSFFTAKSSLCLHALQSAPRMRSCHGSNKCTSISWQKAGYCIYIPCQIRVKKNDLLWQGYAYDLTPIKENGSPRLHDQVRFLLKHNCFRIVHVNVLSLRAGLMISITPF